MKNQLSELDKFRQLFDQAPLGYQSLDIDGNFLEVNQKWLDILGYKKEEVIGKWFGDFLTPEYQNGFRERFPVFKAQGHIHSEFEMVHKNGNILFIAFEGKIGYDEVGSFKQTHCILEDITEKKRNEKTLNDALNILKNAGRLAKFGGWNVVLSEDRSYWSDEVAAIHEMPAGHCPLVEDGINFYAPEWREKITQVFIDCAQKGIPYDEEMEILTSTGKRVWVRTNGEAVRDEKGIIYKVQGGFQDITERKLADHKFKELMTKHKTFIDTVPDIIMEVDRDKVYTWANKAGYEFFGDNVIGKEASYYFEGEQDIYEKVKPLFEGEEEIIYLESYQKRKDGKIRLLAWWCKVYKDLEGNTIGAISSARDITEQRELEYSLRESESKLRNILENSTNLFYSHTIDHVVTFLSPQIEHILGYTQEEALIKWTELASDNPINEIGFRYTAKAIETGKRQPTYELELIRKDGKKIIVEVRESPLIENGKTVAIIGSLVDITERKQAEDDLKKKNKDLEETNSVMVGRELKMIELKKEINELLKAMGKDEKYEC
jgi:PAS domain S-box-containing protein